MTRFRGTTTVDPAVLAAINGRGDFISSWWTVGVLLGLAVALIVAAVLWRRSGAVRRPPARPASDQPELSPRRRRRHAWPLVAGATVLVLLATAVGVNTWVGYIASVNGIAIQLGMSTRVASTSIDARPAKADAVAATISDDPPSGHGRVVGITMSQTPPDLRIPDNPVFVYTPPGYDSSGATAYPLVMLLHGAPGSTADWFGAGLAEELDALITSGEVRPMIVVTPGIAAVDASDSGCLDSLQGGSQVETYLEDVVVPWMLGHYPVSHDRALHAVGGMSAGGYCALDQGLRHRDTFGTILSLLPYDSPGAAGQHQLGTVTAMLAHTPSVYVPTLSFPDPVGVFFAYGSAETDDQVPTAARTVSQLLRDKGQTSEVHVVKGGAHTWHTAITSSAYGLVFFEHQMQEQVRQRQARQDAAAGG